MRDPDDDGARIDENPKQACNTQDETKWYTELDLLAIKNAIVC